MKRLNQFYRLTIHSHAPSGATFPSSSIKISVFATVIRVERVAQLCMFAATYERVH